MRRSATRTAEPKSSARLFAALGDETRLNLVLRLREEGSLSISGLAAGSAISRQAITKHLRVMERARLVHSHRHGRESVWQLDLQALEDARHYLDMISRQWDIALGRLRTMVEE